MEQLFIAVFPLVFGLIATCALEDQHDSNKSPKTISFMDFLTGKLIFNMRCESQDSPIFFIIDPKLNDSLLELCLCHIS